MNNQGTLSTGNHQMTDNGVSTTVVLTPLSQVTMSISNETWQILKILGRNFNVQSTRLE